MNESQECLYLAAQAEVKAYLAHWFQLGKKLYILGGRQALLPQPVIVGDHYSSSFEACWEYIMSGEAGDCYLEETQETLQQLLSDRWEITQCARCQMPVPLPNHGLPPVSCPCANLDNWPNLDLPLPRSPVKNREHLGALQKRIQSL
ncbi:hypothetical protein L3556_03725 [Candidatus Synechococcus calcipolaris G9]|uniref:Uncharacterized protein n=1 Tax=Candidatus Synechococcus calcipolaris G9 TaxID=1497997 RepID=A0ABT6EW85_9SYNE|nr:hypothetical protein [Candidatus Synechococcus calcipolaris]MDG2990047.1 hypothetical protein [Candidatus Synechococcus calcipolaris G9]